MTKAHLKKFEDIQHSLSLIFSKKLVLYIYEHQTRVKTILTYEEYLIYAKNIKILPIYFYMLRRGLLSDPISELHVDAVFRKIMADIEICRIFFKAIRLMETFPTLIEYSEKEIENG